MTDDGRRAMRRQLLLEVVGGNRNTWMLSFGWASHHIAAAVADGRIPEITLVNFVPYHPEDCIALAQKAGIYPGQCAGGEYHADHEDVSIAVDAIRALVECSFDPRNDTWQFHEESGSFEGVSTSWHELEVARAENITDYRSAAQLILDADAAYSAKVRA